MLQNIIELAVIEHPREHQPSKIRLHSITISIKLNTFILLLILFVHQLIAATLSVDFIPENHNKTHKVVHDQTLLYIYKNEP